MTPSEHLPCPAGLGPQHGQGATLFCFVAPKLGVSLGNQRRVNDFSWMNNSQVSSVYPCGFHALLNSRGHNSDVPNGMPCNCEVRSALTVGHFQSRRIKRLWKYIQCTNVVIMINICPYCFHYKLKNPRVCVWHLQEITAICWETKLSIIKQSGFPFPG